MTAALVHLAALVLDNKQSCLNCGVVLLDDVREVGGSFGFGEAVGEVFYVDSVRVRTGDNINERVLYRLRRESLAANETFCQRETEGREWVS